MSLKKYITNSSQYCFSTAVQTKSVGHFRMIYMR